MPGGSSSRTSPEAFFDEHWTWGSPIGGGQCSVVHGGRWRGTDRTVAIKVEARNTSSPYLHHEYQVYRRLHVNGDLPGVPKVLYFGRYAEWNVMVMQHLAPSLSARKRECGGRLSEKTVCMIGLQVVTCLERVHQRGILHRDVKPGNILTSAIDFKRMYLCDFGFAKQFVDSSGRHIPRRPDHRFVGTLEFASINTHRGRTVSRRDDLESLGYTLLFLVEGSLPWERIQQENLRRYVAMAGNMKKRTVVSTSIPGFLQRFFGKVVTLGFDERPDYDSLRGILLRALENRNTVNDLRFDWLGPSSDDGRVMTTVSDMRRVKQGNVLSRTKEASRKVIVVERSAAVLTSTRSDGPTVRLYSNKTNRIKKYTSLLEARSCPYPGNTWPFQT